MGAKVCVRVRILHDDLDEPESLPRKHTSILHTITLDASAILTNTCYHQSVRACAA